MKRKRRTKIEIEWMKQEVMEYLLKTNNDPHKAWDLYIKHHLENNILMPHYIKGIKDFLLVAEEIKEENQKQVYEEKKKLELKDYQEQLSKITIEKYKNELYPIFKTMSNKEKQSMVHLWSCVITRDFKMIEWGDVRVFKKYKIIND